MISMNGPINWQRFLLFLAANVVVSAITMVMVLFLWETFRAPQINANFNGNLAATITPAGQEAVAALPDAGGEGGGAPVAGVTATPQTYTVQSGDTMGTIAIRFGTSVEALLAANDLTNPNILSVGQVLFIPGPNDLIIPDTPTPPAAIPTPLATLTPAPNAESNAQIAVRAVDTPGTLASEAVVLVNLGGVVQLAGWQLQDEDNNTYNFPALRLFAGGQITIHTRTGTNSVTDLYWGLAQPVWQPGETVRLLDPAGMLHISYIIP